jgi:hypothetical protein
MANTTHLFSCLYGNRSHWCFGRQEEELTDRPPSKGSRG